MSPSSSKPGCQFNSKIFKLKQANERLIDWDSYVFIAMLRIQFETKKQKNQFHSHTHSIKIQIKYCSL